MPAVARAAAAPQARVGRFETVRVLGRGAQATVWLAYDPRLEREVALKLLDRGADAVTVDEWLHEARMVGRLKHPNIVPVFEADRAGEQPYLVFEWVDGGTLSEAIRKRGGPWPAPEAVALMVDVLDALAAAHAQGLVHRDLKPSNVLVGADGRARVMDFGIAARVRTGVDGAPDAGTIVGTPGYMSPEAARGDAPAPSMDVFSAGVVLAEMLCGRPLLRETDARRALARSIADDLQLPADAPVDDNLRGIVGCALARDPLCRYEDAASMRDALAAWAQPAAAPGPGGGPGTLDFLLRRIRHRSDFPAMSQTIARIQRLARSDTESLGSLAEAIMKDVALAHKLLRLVNSAHFNQARGGSIGTVSRAVALVGFAGVRNLALSLVMLEHLEDKAHAARLQEEFLRALATAMLAAELAADAGDAEEAYLASLFQNLGRLLTEFYLPEEAQQIRQLLAARPKPPSAEQREAAAQQVLGIGLEALGVGVARSWGFAPAMQRAMCVPSGPPPARMLARGVERQRWLGRAANELTDAMLIAEPAPRQGRLDELAERLAPALGLAPRAVHAATERACVVLGGHVSVLGLQLPSSSPLRRLVAPEARPQAGAVPAADAFAPTTRIAPPVPAAALAPAAAAAADAPAAGRPGLDLLTEGVREVTERLVADRVAINEILRVVLESIWRGLGLRRVLFCLRDPQTDTLTGRFGLGADAQELARRFRVPLRAAAGTPADLFTAVCGRGVDTVISDAGAAGMPARLPAWYREAIDAPSFLLLPLTLRQSTFGLIYGDHALTGGIHLEERQNWLLRTLRNQAVMAFRQAEGIR